ncbi:hypothetical protein GCM10009113_18920 [Marinobacter szutsaonensis]
MAESPQVLEVYQKLHQLVLDVILTLSQATMSHYINHIAQTPVDKPFQKFAWSKNQ